MGGVGKTTLAVEAAWQVASTSPTASCSSTCAASARPRRSRPSRRSPPSSPSSSPRRGCPMAWTASCPLPRPARRAAAPAAARQRAGPRPGAGPRPAPAGSAARHLAPQAPLPGGQADRPRRAGAAEAKALLREIVGARRTDADLAAIAESCGRLPLALRAAGAFLATQAARGRLPGGAGAGRLAAARLGADGPGSTCRRRSAQPGPAAREDATLAGPVRRAGRLPGRLLADAAGAVWEVPRGSALDRPRQARRALAGALGGEIGSYRLHDLVRELAAGRLDEAAREEAAARHAAHYVAVLGRINAVYRSRAVYWMD